MNLTTRMALAMVALVLWTATAVGLLTYRNIASLAPAQALERVKTRVQLLSLDLEASVRGARGDALGFRSAVAIDGMVRATLAGDGATHGGLTAEQWADRMARRFVAELEAKPDYRQFRIVGVAHGARELLRVDRSGAGGAIRVVPQDELRMQGGLPAFRNAIALDNDVYISPVELSRENTIVATPHVPIIDAAAAIHMPDGRPFGVIVITVDLRSAFLRIRNGTDAGGLLFVVNERGDYLLHPDRTREFAFEFGRTAQIQDDFPQIAAMLSETSPAARQIADRSGAAFGVALASQRLAGGPTIAVVEALPHALIMATAMSVRNTSLIGALLAALVAAIIAVFVARSLTGPLVQMTRAVEALPNVERGAIPTGAAGEIGTLARSFARMVDEVRDKMQTQLALTQEIEERRRLFETSQDLIFVTDRQGTFVQVSPSSEAILGYRPEEMIGRSAIEFIHPDDLESTRGEMRAARRGGVIRNFETRYIHKHRRSVSLAWSGVWSNPVQRHFFIGRDMTESKKAQQALLESEQMARGIVDTALDAFVQMDAQGTITEWNLQAEQLFGWTRDEAIGRALGELIVPERHRLRHQEGLARYLRSGTPTILGKRIEIEGLRRDGTEVKVELSITALRRGRTYLFNGFIRDLTEKLAAEERIRQGQKMEAIGQLTGGIAHDFNNILTVITGTVEFLAEGVSDRPQLAAFAKMIEEAAQRGADLTQGLLAFARKQPLQPRQTDINALMSEIERLLKPTLGEQIEIDSFLEEDAWPALVDPAQLTSALLNLALNARDAMPNGGKLMLESANVYLDEIYASAHAEVKPGEYVMIAVSDTGSGIPADVREKVFEPFFTTKGLGTGLGLSMVYGFVKQSGGHIKIYSEEGHGTTIKLYLPRSSAASEQSAAGAISTSVVGGNETVLVVEDDQMVRDYVIAQLESLGYRTLVAANAGEALKIVGSGISFDLLFTDVIMPGAMNGPQLAKEIDKRRPGLKVLFTSGYTENAIVHHGRLDPGVLLLAKPYRKSDLAQTLRRALGDAGAEMQKRKARA